MFPYFCKMMDVTSNQKQALQCTGRASHMKVRVSHMKVSFVSKWLRGDTDTSTAHTLTCGNPLQSFVLCLP